MTEEDDAPPGLSSESKELPLSGTASREAKRKKGDVRPSQMEQSHVKMKMAGPRANDPGRAKEDDPPMQAQRNVGGRRSLSVLYREFLAAKERVVSSRELDANADGGS